MTIAEFLNAHPEFSGAEDTLVQAKIDEATRRRRSDVWGDLQDDGIRILAARLLALTPYGRAQAPANAWPIVSPESGSSQKCPWQNWATCVEQVQVGRR